MFVFFVRTFRRTVKKHENRGVFPAWLQPWLGCMRGERLTSVASPPYTRGLTHIPSWIGLRLDEQSCYFAGTQLCASQKSPGGPENEAQRVPKLIQTSIIPAWLQPWLTGNNPWQTNSSCCFGVWQFLQIKTHQTAENTYMSRMLRFQFRTVCVEDVFWGWEELQTIHINKTGFIPSE